jgi:hypothetical protein
MSLGLNSETPLSANISLRCFQTEDNVRPYVGRPECRKYTRAQILGLLTHPRSDISTPASTSSTHTRTYDAKITPITLKHRACSCHTIALYLLHGRFQHSMPLVGLPSRWVRVAHPKMPKATLHHTHLSMPATANVKVAQWSKGDVASHTPQHVRNRQHLDKSKLLVYKTQQSLRTSVYVLQ